MAKANAAGGVQASEAGSPAMGEMKSFTRNRQLAMSEMERERIEYPGWIAARSLDGIQTFAYGKSVIDIRIQLLEQGLRLCDVVLDAIDGNGIDVDGCRL